MKMIYKYCLVRSENDLSIPVYAEILTVQEQGGAPCLWVLVDPYASTVMRRFRSYGTGQEIPDESLEYVGTVQIGRLVWHIFECL